nr:VAN3-binding protein-like isoform X1 [Ipomoea batatas]
MAKQNSVSYSPAIELEKICWRRSQDAMEASPFHSYPQSREMTSTQTNAMEFLCRTWSPSSNEFLHMLSSGNHLLPVRSTDLEYQQEQLEEMSRNTTSKALATREDDSSVMKQWSKGNLLTRFFRSHQEKKEKLRLRTAKVHAALSLTQLAAAIAGLASSSKAETQEFHFNNAISGEQRNNMGGVLASAAALVTTVCAEAAESLGAGRVQVAAAVNSGLAIHTPIDMLAVTATTATCLRGAAILKSRILEDSLSRTPCITRVSARIWIIMPSGRIEDKWVTVHLKQKQLILSVGKNNFWALRTSKDYKLMRIAEECTEGQHNYILSLKTDSGIVKLLFEDMNQSRIWISTISYLLDKNKAS